jgi:hypothetical protein
MKWPAWFRKKPKPVNGVFTVCIPNGNAGFSLHTRSFVVREYNPETFSRELNEYAEKEHGHKNFGIVMLTFLP